MGSIKMLGQQQEEIAVMLDVERVSRYAVDQKLIMARLATQGFRTMTGEIANDMGAALVHVDVPYRTEYELGEQIIFSDPITGQTVRLKDIATIEHRYKKPEKFVQRFDKKGVGDCILLNIEMQPDNNIVSFGSKVDEVLDHMVTVPARPAGEYRHRDSGDAAAFPDAYGPGQFDGSARMYCHHAGNNVYLWCRTKHRYSGSLDRCAGYGCGR